MPPRHRKLFLGAAALGGVLAAWSGVVGCSGDVAVVSAGGGASTAPGATTGDSVTGGDSATTGSVTSGGGTSSSASAAAGTGGSGGAGPVGTTITDITSGAIGSGVKVKLTGVVAMSRKFLVSKGGSGSCLWGVYVSEPNLPVTKPGSGLALMSYGLNAMIVGDGGMAICPKLGQNTIGDFIPDDTKPGDVLDVMGETIDVTSAQCGPANGFKQPRVSKVSSVIKTGTGPVPEPYKMSAAELAKLVPSGDPAFRAQWLSVKIQIQDVVSEPQGVGPAKTLLDNSGILRVHDTSIASPAADDALAVGTRLDWYGFQAPSFCFGLPVYADLTTKFSAVEGIGAYEPNPPCTWVLQTTNRCLDFNPPSDDCTSPPACN